MYDPSMKITVNAEHETTFLDFVVENGHAFTAAELREMADELKARRPYRGGGGAMAEFVLEAV
jgi:hypothetical protein